MKFWNHPRKYFKSLYSWSEHLKSYVWACRLARIVFRIVSNYKRGASFQWPFGPNFTWSNKETTTIGKTHPTTNIETYFKRWISFCISSNFCSKDSIFVETELISVFSSPCLASKSSENENKVSLNSSLTENRCSNRTIKQNGSHWTIKSLKSSG